MVEQITTAMCFLRGVESGHLKQAWSVLEPALIRSRIEIGAYTNLLPLGLYICEGDFKLILSLALRITLEPNVT